MAKFVDVRVCTDIKKRHQSFIIPAYIDGSIELDQLARYFPGANGLSYKEGQYWVMLRLEGDRLRLMPGQSWDPDQVYLIQFAPNSPKMEYYPASEIDIPNPFTYLYNLYKKVFSSDHNKLE